MVCKVRKAAEMCRREGISPGIYYKWSKDIVEVGKKRPAEDTIRAANTDEVKELRRGAVSGSEYHGDYNSTKLSFPWF